MLQKNFEEYLKTMYLLKKENNEIRVTDIANSLNCTKANVNKYVKQLSENNFITYETYGSIDLTEQGEKIAKKVLEAYDITYLFLKEVLHLNQAQAKEEAEKMKKALSDETINKLAKYTHETLGLQKLDCDYDINNERCISCARRTYRKEEKQNNK